MIEDASAGRYVSGNDLLLDLARAAYHTGNARSWKKVTTALVARGLATWQLTGTIAFLAEHFDELPAFVQRRLSAVPDRATAGKALLDDPYAFRAALACLRLVTRQMTDADLISTVFTLLRADPPRAVQVLRSWRDPRALPFLAGLILGEHAVARAMAAHAIVETAASSGTDIAELVPALARLGHLSEGCYGAVALGNATRTWPTVNLEGLHQMLANHPSARVRSSLCAIRSRLESLRRW